MTDRYKLITLPHFSDDRGETVPFELDDRFPFAVKRVYVITGTPDAVRGGHAHRQEEEVFAAVSGAVTAVVNDGSGDQEIILDRKNQALYVGPLCWHEFKHFSSDAVLLCFSSTHYDGRDGYIENKDEFLAQSP